MFKDKEKQKEANRLAKQKQRKGMTQEGMTGEGMTEYIEASYVEGLTGRFKSLPKRPRFLTLSDNQVLDRANQPQSRSLSGVEIQAIRACNEAYYNFKPNRGTLPKI